MIRALVPISIGLFLNACGGSRPLAVPAASAEPSPSQRMSARNSLPQDFEASYPTPSAAGPASQRASSSESDSERRAPDSTRPGLGTEWGEDRESRVSSAPFDRSDPMRPVVLSTLFYNDREGVRAMTRGGFIGLTGRDGIELGGGAISVRLLDSSGSALPSYSVGARSYVVGSDGDRYVIQIQNHTSQRFESVVSVDGLDVIDGRPGSLEKRGYLVAAWASLEIDGFRRSEAQVAAFRFGSVERSYAASQGDARNVGVIGMAFFSERGSGYPWLAREVEQRRNAEPFPGRFASPPP